VIHYLKSHTSVYCPVETQGCHYMSHTFWAGIFVWLTTWVTALFFYGRVALQAAQSNPSQHKAARMERIATL